MLEFVLNMMIMEAFATPMIFHNDENLGVLSRKVRVKRKFYKELLGIISVGFFDFGLRTTRSDEYVVILLFCVTFAPGS